MSGREFVGEHDRVRLRQEHERIFDLGPVRSGRLVDPDGGIVGDVDAMHGELLAAPVRREGGRADHRHGQLDALDATDGAGDLLREERPLAGGDLESCPTRHGIDDLAERAEHGPVDKIDGTDERHPGGNRADGQDKPHRPAAHEAPGHLQAEERHRADLYALTSA